MTQASELAGDLTIRGAVLGQATAGTADDWTIARFPNDAVVTAIRWIPHAAVTGAATNNFALQAINKGAAGAGTVGVTAAKTYASGTNSAAYVPETLTLSTTASDLNVSAGDVLALVRTVNGTGLAMPDGQVEVSYRLR